MVLVSDVVVAPVSVVLVGNEWSWKLSFFVAVAVEGWLVLVVGVGAVPVSLVRVWTRLFWPLSPSVVAVVSVVVLAAPVVVEGLFESYFWFRLYPVVAK